MFGGARDRLHRPQLNPPLDGATKACGIGRIDALGDGDALGVAAVDAEAEDRALTTADDLDERFKMLQTSRCNGVRESD